jgi:hypothetical protein
MRRGLTQGSVVLLAALVFDVAEGMVGATDLQLPLLKCSNPFVSRVVGLCGIKRCRTRNPRMHLAGTREALPGGQEEYTSEVEIGGRPHRKPVAAFLATDPHEIFRAGYLLVKVLPSGHEKTVLISGFAISDFSAPFQLRLCVLYASACAAGDVISPTPHFVIFAQDVLYRGADFFIVWPEILATAAIGAVYFAFALHHFHRVFFEG